MCAPMVGVVWTILIKVILTTRNAHLIAIFPAGSGINLKHRLTIIIVEIFL